MNIFNKTNLKTNKMIAMEKTLHIYKKCKSRCKFKRIKRRKRKKRRKIKRRNKINKKKESRVNSKMIKLKLKQIFLRVLIRELKPKSRKDFLGKKK